MSAIDEFPRELTLTLAPRGRWVLSIHGPDIQGQASSTTREYLDGIAEAYAAMRRDEEAGELSDQPAAGDPCEHYWAHACRGGLPVRLCLNCDEPDWDDLRGQLNERVMLDLLHQRFGFVSHNGGSPKPRYVCAEQVRAEAGFDTRTLDFVAVDTWRSGKLATHGVEVKVSRGDWLRELKDPSKSAPFLAWTTHFWLAVPDAGVVMPGELPEGWGLLVMRGPRLTARVTAPRRAVPPIPRESLASLLYAVHRTAARRAA